MKTYGSDKSMISYQSWHNYTTYYHALFDPVKYNVLRIFELGLGTNNIALPSNMGINGRPGASLRGWRDFFPKADVYGADIDRDILFTEDRIKTYYCDQLSTQDVSTLWKEPELLEEFDIIVDDGLHTLPANWHFFEHSIHKIKIGGVYIIEDILSRLISSYNELFHEWKKTHPNYEFCIMTLPYTNCHDNNLIIIQRTS
jgi:hypothetical protein